jgi:Domain of unknown function (DUF5615)
MASPPGPPRWVKLLLDVHHSRVAAERLRASGYDVQAAFDHPELAVLADEELLRRASADGRGVVTENVKDFDRIVRSWVATGEHHTGVIFTSPRRFHRGSNSYPENLIVALVRFLANHPVAELDWVHWLE